MKIKSLCLIALVFLTVATFILPHPASAVFIDFETRADGTPYTGPSAAFLSNEYAGLGVTIANSSSFGSGLTNVFLSNPLNVGTSISGYYVNVGAIAEVGQTFLELSFGPSITDVAFDFATPSGGIQVLAFD